MEEFIEDVILLINSNKESAGHTLFRIHLTGMLLLPIVFLSIPMVRIPIFICYIPLYIYHLIKKRCPLTRVERKLHGLDQTVTDVFLGIFGFKTTKDNRNRMMLFMSSAFMILMIYVISIMST
jgi:hypothetical protein